MLHIHQHGSAICMDELWIMECSGEAEQLTFAHLTALPEALMTI